jgi:hypothetical protein
VSVPATLRPGEEPPVSTGQKAGWDTKLMWPLWRREKYILPRIEHLFPGLPTHTLATILNNLSLLGGDSQWDAFYTEAHENRRIRVCSASGVFRDGHT